MGLTVFILDMKSPGVEVRPIKQISGASHFNEVFLDEVYIPDARRIGQVGQGWKIALGMLMNERLTVGRVFSPDVGPLIRVAAQTEINGAPAIDNGMVRERLARWYSEQQGIRHTVSRVMTALSKGRDPGPEASIIKIIDAAREYEMAGFALDLLGPAALDRAGGADAAPALIGAFLEAPGTRIGGGTEEILLNVIAERVLGLPGDIRVDKDIPFDAAVAQ
jgi:alkylation response protein AidB-like acyl-CoA dehydrogenase